MKSIRYCIPILFALSAALNLNAQLDDCDFNCGTFSEKAPISYGNLKASLAVFDGKIFATGAADFWSEGIVGQINYDTLYVYDPATDSWDKDRTPIPVPRFCWTTNLVIDGKWYFPGGYVHQPGAEGGFHPAPLSRHDVYDPEHDRWELRSSLPFPLNGKAAAVNGKIYVTGGIREDIAPQSCLFMYDPSTDLWTMKSDMHVVRHDHIVVEAGGKIYAIGGKSAYGEHSYPMNFNGEVYDPETDQWNFIADPPDSLGVELSGYAIVEGEIYVLAGFTSLEPHISTRNIFKYVPASDQWIYIGRLPGHRVSHSTIAIGRTIYILGGWIDPRSPGDPASRDFTALKLGDITLDSLPRLETIAIDSTETIDLSAYFRHIQEKAMSYRICMDPQFEDELSAVIEGESLKLTATSAGYARLRVLAEEGEHRMGFDLELDMVTGTGPLQAPWDPELHVYPNPLKGSTTINFELPYPDQVRLAILDVTGKEIATLVEAYRLPGKQQVTWNAAGMKPGIYICSISVSGNRAYTKIIVE